ncbi:MAG: hypothetical protein GVY10_01080 [Verrucomicrobia bacterium]|jgi:REP element-mobilizing transposase RayT|nr:hypothetical protein [Verrucomicrobiota bacterium]
MAVRREDQRSAIIFLTVCTKGRKCILATDASHHLLLQAWKKADNWTVGKYLIMPDHVHLFCSPSYFIHKSIQKWQGYWKYLVSRDWKDTTAKPLWQIGGWDRQLRGADSYAAKWRYVRENPVRAGLVTNAESWPYQGELNRLEWRD